MYTPLTGSHSVFPDAIHPNRDVACMIVETVYQHITN